MKMLFIQNAAANKIETVTFIRWFDSARRYARVKLANGTRVSVPANLLFPVAL